MKVRQGFVSNSSSSSFIIKKQDERDLPVEFPFNLVNISYDNVCKYVLDNLEDRISHAMTSISRKMINGLKYGLKQEIFFNIYHNVYLIMYILMSMSVIVLEVMVLFQIIINLKKLFLI